MSTIDWLIVALPVLICAAIAVYTRTYVRGVADFMAGGRHAGRFLISTARSEQGSGAVVFVNSFQSLFVSGFALGWWGQLSVPIGPGPGNQRVCDLPLPGDPRADARAVF